ncbi:SGNH/GDSL hydrolase family protein [candidate division KSB1 bacterium]|nr:SGNH/GDSL hydrolase family protein [candidate division KSB1 bacterium]
MQENIEETENEKSNRENNRFTYLALGDSYTIGESVETSQRYPVLLVNRLRQVGYSVSDPVIVARTGWTTDELAAGITASGVTGPFDLVSLLIGVNNQYRGRDVDTYRTEFCALLQQAVDFAGGKAEKVFVLSIPDWGVTPFAASWDREKIAREIDQYNAVNREETCKRGILYVDVTPVSRQALEDPSLIAEDGLHPSGKMYAAWVERALPGVIRILNQGKTTTP